MTPANTASEAFWESSVAPPTPALHLQALPLTLALRHHLHLFLLDQVACP